VELGSVLTTGLPIEQVEQLALAVADGRATADAVVLTTNPVALRRVRLEVERAPGDAAEAPAERPELSVERVAYGNDDVLVVTITDVHDDLGESLTELLTRERSQGRVGGIVLDLRSDGGGSTDGAIGALGIFLPGVPLFPMRRRDGSMETDRAPDVDGAVRWTGPVATLVDGDTASAAEMIAGALASYRRGPILGTRTFGKGCAQEYMDDEAGAGVLRLTTLLYALPDGTAVQQKGLTPTHFFPFPRTSPGKEREADLPNAPPPWTGPDMREKSSMPEPGAWTAPWPPHEGRVGPCTSADVCRALRMLEAPFSRTRTRHVSAKLH
jgi:carboxyl-terminal processing protease